MKGSPDDRGLRGAAGDERAFQGRVGGGRADHVRHPRGPDGLEGGGSRAEAHEDHADVVEEAIQQPGNEEEGGVLTGEVAVRDRDMQLMKEK